MNRIKVMPEGFPWTEAQYRKACDVLYRLRDNGYEAYFAGGCVRDLILSRVSPDIDIATSAKPEEVTRLFPRVVPIGIKYGVVAVIWEGQCFEVTTFRRDYDYRDHRHPDRIEFTDAQTDAQRRDFTLNGLFYDPTQSQVIDFVNGLEDITNGCIRAIGCPRDRFEEDPLRMLRAVRFAGVLDFRIEPQTMKAIQAGFQDILTVSWERIRDEIVKMFTGPKPAEGLDLLDESGLLSVVLPEVQAMHGVEQPVEFHPEGDVFTHTRLMLSWLEYPTITLVMGVLLHDVGKPATFQVSDRIRFDRHVEVGCALAETVCRRLKFPNEETKRILDLVGQHMRFMPVQEMRPGTLKRFLRQEHFEEHLELHRVDCLGSHGDLSNWIFCRQQLETLQTEEMRPRRLLGGRDLIRLGYIPGPQFRQILMSLEDAQLEGQIQQYEQAVQWVTNQFPLRKEGG